MLRCKWRSTIILILSVFVLTMSFPLLMAKAVNTTYYVAPSNQDGSDANAGTVERPWATFSKAFSVMSPSDTLIVKDGVYYESLKNMPSGSASAGYTTIKAEHDGKAIFDSSRLGAWATALDIRDRNYVQVEGFKFVGGRSDGTATGAGFIMSSHHVKILRSAFMDNGYRSPDTTGNISTFIIEQSHHILVEDSWAAGWGRYKFEAHESDKIIFRRTVARHDRTDSRYPQALYSIYRSSDVQLQNAIGIDSDQADFYTGYAGFYGAIYSPNSDTAYPNNGLKILGSIMLNIKGNSADIPFTLGQHIIKDSVFWHNIGGVGYDYPTSANVLLDHVTIGDIYGERVGDINPSSGVGAYGFGPGTSIVNSVLYQNRIRGLHYFGFSDYNDFYGNGENYGAGWSGDRLQTPTPQGSHDRFVNPGFRFITRIETNSPLKGAARDGGDIGANVLRRYGVSGTLWGDQGYDLLANDSLWPWPNETRIAADFASYNPSGGPVGARGFAAPGTTLTKYIWEYLGNTCPAEICDTDVLTAPAVPAPSPAPNSAPIASPTPLPASTPVPSSPATAPTSSTTPSPAPTLAPIPLPATPPIVFPDGTLLRERGRIPIYLIENGLKRRIANMRTFRRHGFKMSMVKTVSHSVLDNLPDGPALSR